MTGHAFLDADSCGRICLVLFHSLWQMGLVAMLAWLLGRKWRTGSVEWAYWAHVAGLVVGLAAMPATFLLLADRATEGQSIVAASGVPSEQAPVVHSLRFNDHPGTGIILDISSGGQTGVLKTTGPGPDSQGKWKRFAPWLFGVYSIGAAMMFVRLGVGIARTERMRRKALPLVSGEIAQSISLLAARWRLKFQPMLGQLDGIVVPTVIGVIRPMILLPGLALTSMTHEELELILAHELAHVRRYDLWVNLLQRIGEAALFFNPAVWYLSRRISSLREYCCDELVCGLQEGASEESRTNYAVALLRAVELARPGLAANPSVAALAADGSSPSELRRRVARLLGEPCHEPLRVSKGGLICVATLAITLVASPAWFRYAALAAANGTDTTAKTGDEGGVESANKALKNLAESKQQVLKLPVRVVDLDGKPVANAKVTPWALRDGQGHGLWSKDSQPSGLAPEAAITGDDGVARVLYPKYSSWREKVATTGVSVNVDHPDFAFVSAEHINDLPLPAKGPHEIKLKPGVAVEVRPLLDGKPATLDGLYALWSDGRSQLPEYEPEKTSHGGLRFRGMAPGKNSVLLVRLDGERATHFSKITDFELKAGETKTLDVPLEPSVVVRGKVSDEVPRPIKSGWIKTWSLGPPPEEGQNDRVLWFSWSPIQADGTFTIDGWPANERIQLVAVCDGCLATSGKAPDVVKNPRDPAHDPFLRAQVFTPQDKEPIEVPMTPMVKCDITVVDEGNAPVAGVKVGANPNVQWWNGGSQIYGLPLARCERMLRERDFEKSVDADVFTDQFQIITDATGKGSMYLPVGGRDLGVSSDVYELPVFLGRRWVLVNVEQGKPCEVTLNLQPRGTEQLGDWDKLAGVVFGCSTREGRRICALPEVQKKMAEFEQRFRDGKSRRDPQLLSEAYTTVADAFAGVGDQEEAAKWHAKAAVEASKVSAKQEH